MSEFKETAIKSSNGSAELRAQGGKSSGRGAVEISDTHLSEWINARVAQAKIWPHKCNQRENSMLKRSWVCFFWSFPLLPSELMGLFLQMLISRQASTAQHTSSSSQVVKMLNFDAQSEVFISWICVDHRSTSAFIAALPVLGDKRADLYSDTDQVWNFAVD